MQYSSSSFLPCDCVWSTAFVGIDGKESILPIGLDSMIPWALLFAADIAAGEEEEADEPKRRRRNEMVGD